MDEEPGPDCRSTKWRLARKEVFRCQSSDAHILSVLGVLKQYEWGDLCWRPQARPSSFSLSVCSCISDIISNVPHRQRCSNGVLLQLAFSPSFPKFPPLTIITTYNLKCSWNHYRERQKREALDESLWGSSDIFIAW